MSPANDGQFEVFTSLRYDTQLLHCSDNDAEEVSFASPSPFYMLRYHRDRLLEAAEYFGWEKVVERLQDGIALQKTLLEYTERYSHNGNKGPFKVRLSFNRAGTMNVSLSAIPPAPLNYLYPRTLDLLSASAPSKPFNPSPLTGGALTLGPTDTLSSSPSSHPAPTWDLYLDTHPTPLSAHTTLKTSHRPHYDAARSRALPTTLPSGRASEVLLHNSSNEIIEGSITTPYLFRGRRWVTPPVTERVGESGQRGTTRRWALRTGLCVEEAVGRESVRVGEEVWVSNGARGWGLGRVIGVAGTGGYGDKSGID